MLLQLALGPVSLLIFNIAASSGFTPAMQGVIGVTLVDAIFVFAAILGIGTILNKNQHAKKIMAIGGAIIMLLFGLNILLGSLGINLLPSMNIDTGKNEQAFVKAVVLTGANPMTILFWAGVFSTKMVEDGMHRKDMFLFGFGAILTTPFSLSLISIVGSTAKVFLSNNVLLLLNGLVGILLIAFSIKMLLPQKRKVQSAQSYQ